MKIAWRWFVDWVDEGDDFVVSGVVYRESKSSLKVSLKNLSVWQLMRKAQSRQRGVKMIDFK